MSACCSHTHSASRLFSFFAKRYRRRFKKHGFEPSQKQLLQGLELVDYRDGTLLEIGCGVGHLHQKLLQQGARSAVGVDLAPKMLAEAKALAVERGVCDRAQYLEGDFIDLYDQIEPVNITLLDKVVCCYPDAGMLVSRSLDKTNHVYAVTYPRNRWFVRLGVALTALVLCLIRSGFRSYVHDPKTIEAWITQRGFVKRFQEQTSMWLTQIYVRA